MVCWWWNYFWKLLPSLLESSGVLRTLLCGLRQWGWSLFTWRHTALKMEERMAGEENTGMKQKPERKHVRHSHNKWRKEKERGAESWVRASTPPVFKLDFCYFWLCDSPLFVRMWCCQGARPKGISGCSVVCRFVVTRTAAVMMHPTSGRRGTDWSAGLKKEDMESVRREGGSLRCFPFDSIKSW